jgi:hypothetical protein
MNGMGTMTLNPKSLPKVKCKSIAKDNRMTADEEKVG